MSTYDPNMAEQEIEDAAQEAGFIGNDEREEQSPEERLAKIEGELFSRALLGDDEALIFLVLLDVLSH